MKMLGSLIEIPTTSVIVPITEQGGYLKSNQISNILTLADNLISAENTFSKLSESLIIKKQLTIKYKNKIECIINYFPDFQSIKPLSELSLITKNYCNINENYINSYEKLNESINLILNYLKEKKLREDKFSIGENKIESEINDLADKIEQMVDTVIEPSVEKVKELTHEMIQKRSTNSPENIQSKLRVYHLIKGLRKKAKDLKSFISLQIKELKYLLNQAIEKEIFKEILIDDILKECESTVENIKNISNTLDKKIFKEELLLINSLIKQIQGSTIPEIKYHVQQKKIEKNFIRPLLLVHGRFHVLKKIYSIMRNNTTFEELGFPTTLEYPLCTEPDINRRISLQMIKNREWIRNTLNNLEEKRKIMCDAYYGASPATQKNIFKEVREYLTGRALRETVLEWKETCGGRFKTPFQLNIDSEIYFNEYLDEQKEEIFNLIFNQIFPVQQSQDNATNLGKRPFTYSEDPNPDPNPKRRFIDLN